MIRRLAAVAVLAAILAATAAPPARAATPPPTVDARAWVLIDAEDGTRLAAQEPNRELAIASTTKMMTAYVALHDLRFHQRLIAPAYHPIAGESLMGLEPGESDTVHDLLYGLLLPSGNDAAVTLADGAAGSVPAFVARMNAAAERLGLEHTHYSTPVGLDTPGNYSTAADLASLARTLLRDPRFARIVNTDSKTLRSGAVVRTVVNRNDLLAQYPWIIGVKTGYTIDARNVLVSAGRRHGVTLISAVLGAPTEAARDGDSLALLQYGFSLYRPRQAIAKGEALARPVIRDQAGRLPLVAARTARVWARTDQPVAVAKRAPAAVRGPIHRGRPLGRATVSVAGTRVASVPLLAARSVPVATVAGGVESALPGDPPEGAVAAAGAVAIAAGLATALLAMTAPGAGRLRGRSRE